MGKQISRLILYIIKIKTIEIIKLCEKLYSENTHSGISKRFGFPNLILEESEIRLNKKYIPNDKRSGIAPKTKDNHLYFRYPNSPLPQSA